MKKNFFRLLFACMCVVLSLSVWACAGNSGSSGSDKSLLEFSGVTFSSREFVYDGNEHEIKVTGSLPTTANVSYTSNKATLPGTYNASATISADGYKTKTLNATLTISVTKQVFVTAAANSAADDKQEYDFKFNVKGSAGILGFSGAVNGNYDAQYRYEKSSGKLNFKRETSGALFYDSTKYIINQGDQKITLTQDENGKVKKIAVDSADDDTSLINRSFESLIGSLTESQMENFKSSTDSEYQYQFNINVSSNNAIANTVLNIVKSVGLNISIGSVSFTNPLSGVVVYFNLDGNSLRLSGYKLGMEVKVPIKAVDTALTLTYEQHKNTASVNLPNTAGLKINKTDVAAELAKINAALDVVKYSDAYSLDLVASNEFDPGVTTWATKDSYTSRMYKNTADDNSIAFNKSYVYKTHHEEDGKESYKYTIGNIQDGKVYLVSRKGSNTETLLEGVTQDTLFDGMTTPFVYTANEVDCIRTETKGDETTYYVYLGKLSTVAVADKICDLINSNDADGVIPVDNYFNDDEYTIDGADMIVKMVGGAISEISIETNIKYNPIGGDYTERVIKLTDILKLEVNKKLSAAQKYKAPKKADALIGGLDYIL